MVARHDLLAALLRSEELKKKQYELEPEKKTKDTFHKTFQSFLLGRPFLEKLLANEKTGAGRDEEIAKDPR